MPAARLPSHSRPPRTTPAGEALFAVMVETLRTFFSLRGAGKRMGTVTAWGAGNWGLLRSLSAEGPRTVPEIARSRHVARQHIQKLANELAREGLVEFADNPRHRRSKLLRLTAKGARRLALLTRRIQGLCGELARGMGTAELETAAAVLRRLQAKLGEGRHGGRGKAIDN